MLVVEIVRNRLPARLCAATAVSVLLHSALLLVPKEVGWSEGGNNTHDLSKNRISVRLTPPSIAVVGATSRPGGVMALRQPQNLSLPASKGQLSSSGSSVAGEIPAAGISLPVRQYVASEELSTQPEPLAEPFPINVPWGRASAGKIVLTLYIGSEGAVDTADVDTVDNVPAVFQSLLLRSFKGMRFVPGLVDGYPVPSRIRIEVMIRDEE